MAESKAKSGAGNDNVHKLEKAKAKVAESVERTQEELGKKVGTVRAKFADVAEEANKKFKTASETASRLSGEAKVRAEHARKVARERYDVTSQQVREGYTRVRRDADDLVDNATDYVRENPGKGVLIAAGIGFVLGLLFRRRD